LSFRICFCFHRSVDACEPALKFVIPGFAVDLKVKAGAHETGEADDGVGKGIEYQGCLDGSGGFGMAQGEAAHEIARKLDFFVKAGGSGGCQIERGEGV